jgi:hypothetical protein
MADSRVWNSLECDEFDVGSVAVFHMESEWIGVSPMFLRHAGLRVIEGVPVASLVDSRCPCVSFVVGRFVVAAPL